MQEEWAMRSGCHLICVDSYDNSILQGRVHSLPDQQMAFCSLSQLLIQMEHRLEHSCQRKEPYHRFCAEPYFPGAAAPTWQKGKLATFRLRILFQQHTSWQGTLQWLEGAQEESFRSVLELVILLDSALQNLEMKKFLQESQV